MPKKATKVSKSSSDNFVVDSKKPFISVKNNSKYASASKRTSSSDHLYMYSNPAYTDQELEFFEDAWGSSIAGAVLDKLCEYTFGGGITPVFELIDESGLDDEQKKNEIKKYESELNELIEYDRKMHFEKKLKDAITMTMVFGRGVIAFEGRGLPKALKVIHPRDLGRVFINQKDWSLEKVITTFPSDELVPDDMIYLVNRPDSPRRRTMWYGYSDLQRVVGAARAWRRIVEYDMPEIATSMWSGYGMFLVKKMGRSKADAENDMNTLLNSLKSGAFNAVSVDANDEIEFHKLDLEPKIKEMVDLASFYERIIIGNSAVPSALLGREEDQNRATLLGKIQFFLSGVVKSKRDWISEMVSKQWYERNMIKMGMGDLLEKVRVKAEFESIIVESWFDLVDSVLRIKGIFPDMPDDQLLELLNLEEYKSELAQAPTRATNVPQGNTSQDLVNKQLNKTISQTDTVSAKAIDDELIKHTLNAKKLEVLSKIDKMIENANKEKTKSDKKRN
tara:strand:+ start:7567 stop:9084 length:1518 start_codon:yes stop_codon:yes gene_type:complete